MILHIASRQPLNAHPRCYSEVWRFRLVIGSGSVRPGNKRCRERRELSRTFAGAATAELWVELLTQSRLREAALDTLWMRVQIIPKTRRDDHLAHDNDN